MVAGPSLLILIAGAAAWLGRPHPPPPSDAAPAQTAAPVDRLSDARRMGAAGRFRTALEIDPAGAPHFGPLTPLSGGETRRLVSGPPPAPFPARRPRGAPAAGVTFLVRVETDGALSSADPVGALLVEPGMARWVGALLRASRIEPYAADEPVIIAVEVSVTFPGDAPGPS